MYSVTLLNGAMLGSCLKSDTFEKGCMLTYGPDICDPSTCPLMGASTAENNGTGSTPPCNSCVDCGPPTACAALSDVYRCRDEVAARE